MRARSTIRRFESSPPSTGAPPAQVVIRWHLDEGLVAIPKTARRERLAENFDVFGFALDAEDRAAIAALDRADGRIGPDPMTAAF